MLNLNYCYRIYPDPNQEKELLDWLEICRGVYNYALAERKEWINSRKCQVNACSLHSEYIISDWGQAACGERGYRGCP